MDDNKFHCQKCDTCFDEIYQLLKHERIQHEYKAYVEDDIKYRCPMCKLQYSDIGIFKSHIRKCDKFIKNQKCLYCKKSFINQNTLTKHLIKCGNMIGFGRKNKLPKLPANSKFMLSRVAFKAFLQQYELFSEKTFKDVTEFFSFYKKDIIELIARVLEKLGPMKIQFCLSVSFATQVKQDFEIYTIGYFCANVITLNNINQIENKFSELIDFMDNEIQEFTSRGSGWYIHDIDRLDLRIGQYNPISGSCHHNLPKVIANKKAIIDIKNTDEKCFLWAVIASVFQAKSNPQRISQYKKYIKEFNLKDVKFPMKLEKIPKFEEKNKHLNISINVFTWNKLDKHVTSNYKPILTSKILNPTHEVNLLLLENHYYYIKNLKRLIFDFSSYNHEYCVNCFQQFKTKQRLDEHKSRCLIFKPAQARFPKNNKLYFNNYSKMMKFPFVIYADFESVLITKHLTKENINNKTRIINNHIPCGYSMIVIENEDNIYYNTYYRGIDCIENFLVQLKRISQIISNMLAVKVVMNELTEDEQIAFENATHCYLCEKPFEEIDFKTEEFNNIKVRDHCHITGKYNGPAHNDCNINYQLPNYLPLFFHNLKGYDSHFIISKLSQKNFEKCEIIPVNMEKFISFKLDSIQILDSFQFLSESLDKLVENLRNSNYDFPITSKLFNEKFGCNSKYNHLLFKKSIYPYEYMNSFDKFNETVLPPKQNFFSSLSQTDITDEDYIHAKKVWKSFNIKNLGGYHDFYVNLDTSLLADVFQAFRKSIFDTYKLEPAHFFSIPGLAWCAALKETKVELELFQDSDFYQFFEMGIRGGICGVTKRLSKANNPETYEYDKTKPTTYLTYLDFNNLYGWAMTQLLPKDNFEWLNENEFYEIDWKNIDTEQDIGYVLEVDLNYPSKLHNKHKDFPLAPHKFKIKNELLSEYQSNTVEYLKNFGYKRTITEKLMLTFYDRKNYIIHFKNLKLYLNLGMKLKKIHRVVKFKQEKFLKKYILKNTKLRRNSINDFLRDLYKLMNNAVYGKALQNMRNLQDIKLALREAQLLKYLSKPNFQQFIILDENKALIKMRKTIVDLNKPIYIGFTVLELSKYLMYDRHYNYFKRYYDDDITLCYFDTDSFLYEIKTENLMKELGTIFKYLMDFSNFDEDHELYDMSKAKLIGYLKSEYGNKVINEFVGLKSKLYSIIYNNNLNKNTAKGLQKAILKKFVNHNHYLQVINDQRPFVSTMRRIQSKEHKVTTIKQKKMIFTPMDDKRYILPNGIETLPFGHWKINNS
jgi:hypothetical protein